MRGLLRNELELRSSSFTLGKESELSFHLLNQELLAVLNHQTLHVLTYTLTSEVEDRSVLLLSSNCCNAALATLGSSELEATNGQLRRAGEELIGRVGLHIEGTEQISHLILLIDRRGLAILIAASILSLTNDAFFVNNNRLNELWRAVQVVASGNVSAQLVVGRSQKLVVGLIEDEETTVGTLHQNE